jgi:hypothetical protein
VDAKLNHLIFTSESNRLMLVNYRVRDGQFEVDSPVRWSDAQLGDIGVLMNFDVAPDGRVVALTPGRASSRKEIM